MPTQDYVPTNEELDAALKGAKVKCKVLLLTNPSNPLGIVFSRYTHMTCDTWPRMQYGASLGNNLAGCSAGV
jgi:hypothetical protein